MTFRPIALVTLLCLLTGASHAADQPTVPMIFIPGFAASAPRPGTILLFTLNRGVSPESLALSVSYRAFVRSANAAGYVDGETFFGGVYDWRMLAAPNDHHFDGNLELVTAQSITSGDYRYAINYLGYWLDRVVQTNPDAEYVDIVTHSTGGILARGYVQSPAYGGTYIDSQGIERRLPKIRHLILGACPNEGTVHSWRPWNGDFQDVLGGFIPTTEIEGRSAALAYAYVIMGGRIAGPDYDITRRTILRRDEDGKKFPNETLFFRKYVPIRQSLTPTNNFLLPVGSDKAINVNERPGLRSDVLLDLNARSRPGVNLWARRVGQPNRQGGVIATFASGAREKKSIKDFFIPGLVNQNEFIGTLNGIVNLKEGEGKYLPLGKLLTEAKPKTISVEDSPFPRIGNEQITLKLAGDGNAPFVSYRSTLGGDPFVRLVQWGNGAPPDYVPNNVRWSYLTNYPVYHVVFFYNPSVRQFVFETTTGKKIHTTPIITDEELRSLATFLSGRIPRINRTFRE